MAKEHFLKLLISYYISCSKNSLFLQFQGPFLMELFLYVYLFEKFYILDPHPMSDAQMAKIFFHSAGCLSLSPMRADPWMHRGVLTMWSSIDQLFVLFPGWLKSCLKRHYVSQNLLKRILLICILYVCTWDWLSVHGLCACRSPRKQEEWLGPCDTGTASGCEPDNGSVRAASTPAPPPPGASIL